MNVKRGYEAIIHKNTQACVAHEYGDPGDVVNAAVIELSGRYPDGGWVLNTACTALLHVVDGEGRIIRKDSATDLTMDDQVLITSNEPYALDGHMKLLYVATPAWTPDQAEYIS